MSEDTNDNEAREFAEFIRVLALPDSEKNFAIDLAQLGWRWDNQTEEFRKGKVRLDSAAGRKRDPIAAELASAWRKCRRLFALLEGATPAAVDAAALAFELGSIIPVAHRRILSNLKKGRHEDNARELFRAFDEAEASFKAAKNTGDAKFKFKDVKDHWRGGQELPFSKQKYTAWRKWKKAGAAGTRRK